MYPKIAFSADAHRSIYYNEKKVGNKMAEFIYAGNFIKEAHQLTIEDKLQRFDSLNELNQRAKKKNLHLSLNFDPSEKIPRDKMIRIARAYMEGIGFGKQPYLIYQHFDVAHPHLHILASAIRPHLPRLRIYIYESESVRKGVEIEFGLAEAYKKKAVLYKTTGPPQKLLYGQGQTKSAVANVLDYVLANYTYTSLTELNDILKLYNVKVHPGLPGSRTYEHKGMAFRVMDEQGRGIGALMKASAFPFKPTLAHLEQKFRENKIRREPDLPGLRSQVSYAIRHAPGNWEQFEKTLKKEKVRVIPHYEKDRLTELCFLDMNTKTTVLGSELGKEFQPGALLKNLGLDPSLQLMGQNKQMNDRLSQDLSKDLNKEQKIHRGRSL